MSDNNCLRSIVSDESITGDAMIKMFHCGKIPFGTIWKELSDSFKALPVSLEDELASVDLTNKKMEETKNSIQQIEEQITELQQTKQKLEKSLEDSNQTIQEILERTKNTREYIESDSYASDFEKIQQLEKMEEKFRQVISENLNSPVSSLIPWENAEKYEASLGLVLNGLGTPGEVIEKLGTVGGQERLVVKNFCNLVKIRGIFQIIKLNL